MEQSRIRIGCPVWSCPHWRGMVYRPKSPRTDWLKEYSQVFSTVEGNSTFYGIPELDTFKRWADQTVEGFRFVLKFPRAISHEKKLLKTELETDQFLAGLDILYDANRLGPTFIQFSPSFGPPGLGLLKNYLSQLPTQFPYAIEVRHPDFFVEPYESELNGMLREFCVDRVIFDSRPLFSAPASDEIEEVSQNRKPKVPIRTMVTGKTPILRIVGRNDLSSVTDWFAPWKDQVMIWKKEGFYPYIFAHTPDDQFAPRFAQTIAKSISEGPEICFAATKKQQRLFD